MTTTPHPTPDTTPALLLVAPRFVVTDLPRTLAFYRQLGFQTTHDDGNFAIVKRDGVTLHFNAFSDLPKGHSVCWIEATHVDALYQEYLPSQAVQSSPHNQPWGFREFFVRDPFGNLLLFAERLPEQGEKAHTEHNTRG